MKVAHDVIGVAHLESTSGENRGNVGVGQPKVGPQALVGRGGTAIQVRGGVRDAIAVADQYDASDLRDGGRLAFDQVLQLDVHHHRALRVASQYESSGLAGGEFIVNQT